MQHLQYIQNITSFETNWAQHNLPIIIFLIITTQTIFNLSYELSIY